MYLEITRCETVRQHRTTNWGEPELAAWKTKCQQQAKNDKYYADLFAAIKDMSIEDILLEYDKWGMETGNDILIKRGTRDVPLGEIIDDEITEAVRAAEVVEDSAEDIVNHIRTKLSK